MSEQTTRAIRATREAHGVSLRSLAARVGVSPATLSAVERGLTPLTLGRLEAIAGALDVPTGHLLDGRLPSTTSPEASLPQQTPGSWRQFDDLHMGPVLEAAASLFVRKGYHATSMREVASEAGLSVAGVYHHHPSKEHILVALLDLTMAEIGWRLEAARREGHDAIESFSLMVEALALFHAVRGDLAFIGASEMRAFSPGERARITALRDDIQHALDRQARFCADGGESTTKDLRTATRAIATMCTSLPSWFRTDGPQSAAEVAHSYARYAVLLIDGVQRP